MILFKNVRKRIIEKNNIRNKAYPKIENKFRQIFWIKIYAWLHTLINIYRWDSLQMSFFVDEYHLQGSTSQGSLLVKKLILKEPHLQESWSAKKLIRKKAHLQQSSSSRNLNHKEVNLQGISSARNHICKEAHL